MNSFVKFFLIYTLLTSSFIYSQDKAKLGESEIRDSEKIRFTNRSNARAAENVKRQNDSIGKKLSEMIESEPTKTHDYKGISVRRVFADKDGQYGGDIISLEPESTFGHINSLYRILTSYISNSFGYSEDRADIIALYVLYYNAMHRNQKSYFKSKYTDELLDILRPSSTGIGKTYKEWPGKTQIVIPLEGNILKENEIDVQLDELGNEVNKIIDEKKNGPEEKRKFAEVIKEKIQEEKKLIQEKKEELKLKEEKIALLEKPQEPKTVVEPKKEPVVEKKAEIKQDPPKEVVKEMVREPVKNTPVEPAKTVAQPIKETAPVKTETAEKPKEVKQAPPVDTEKLKKELKEAKQELAKKTEAENKKKEFSPNVIDGKIVFLKVVKYDTAEGHYNSELHLIDPEKDNAVSKSDFNKICSRQFKEFGGNLVVVGFKDGHKDEHQLYLISKKDLKEVGKSTTNVFSRTVIEVMGDELYAFEFEKGNYYISKYDKSLRRIMKSDRDINPDSNLTFYGKNIYVTGKAETGNAVDIRIFNKDDLKFIAKIQP
ncbi:MAG TPA: P83/100 family protein [Leptospiraceae bacterium]|nr:P83/100 family protein [Leptospiraceae bacterium]HMW08267.1 P83/100 family protein [Leptospiraceae bacterium]HMX35150.1 P83/100 family protein [Leptospiraceae bacterium]HMY34033.1 P83/100 family protein [Leptospiraceae bacterium]HMZ67146.1 P83/100 family protein [Leptospiraceae bacterium]